MDDQRDYAEEAANRADMEAEAAAQSVAFPLRIRLLVLGERGPAGPRVIGEFIHAVPVNGTPVQNSGMHFHEPVTGYRLEVIPW